MVRKPPEGNQHSQKPCIVGSKAELEAQLKDRIDKGQELVSRDIQDDGGLSKLKADYYNWTEYNTDLLKQRFTTEQMAKEYSSIGGMVVGRQSFLEKVQDTKNNIRNKIRRLNSIRDRLQLYQEVMPSEVAQPTEVPTSNKVFIIHGRNVEAALELQKLLNDQLSLDAIMLKDEPGKSRTLIEKFEDEAPRCGFAFALFTKDDFVNTGEENYFQMRPNTVFELGWFCGRLRRDKTCILLQEGTTLPSDLEGIETLRFRQSVEEVYLRVQKELRAAGLAE